MIDINTTRTMHLDTTPDCRLDHTHIHNMHSTRAQCAQDWASSKKTVNTDTVLTAYTLSPSRPDGNIHDPTCAAKITMEHTRRLSLSLNDKPRLTAQVPTTHEWNTASLQLSTRRQERTPIDTTLSLTCKRGVAHRICSRCYDLHPRFDRNLLTNQDFFLLQTANLASLHDQTVIVERRALTETAQHEQLQSPATTTMAQIVQHDLIERSTMRNRLWIKHCVC